MTNLILAVVNKLHHNILPLYNLDIEEQQNLAFIHKSILRGQRHAASRALAMAGRALQVEAAAG